MNLNDKLEQIKVKKIQKKVLESPNKIQLYKDNNYENINIAISKKLVSSSSIEDTELLKQKIKEFLVTMHSKCKNFDDTIFIKNIRKTYFDVSKAKKTHNKNPETVNFYNGCNLFPVNSFSKINTNFMYLSSIDYDMLANTNHSENPYENLIFMNEIYSRLLLEKYFETHEYKSKHHIAWLVFKQLNYILGEDFLEKSFFNGSLTNALFKLQKYLEPDELVVLFERINYVFNLEEDLKLSINEFDKYEMQYSMTTIAYILLTCIKRINSQTQDINKKVEFFASNKFLVTDIAIPTAVGKTKFEFYNKQMLYEYSDELKIEHNKIKEINR